MLQSAQAATIATRFFAAIAILFAASTLASCGSVSEFVTDHWPTWAGGEPKDVPPRPGAPGYAEFIARQQGNAVAPDPAAALGPMPPVTATAPINATAPAAPAATADNPKQVPVGSGRVNDQGAVQGGLY